MTSQLVPSPHPSWSIESLTVTACDDCQIHVQFQPDHAEGEAVWFLYPSRNDIILTGSSSAVRGALGYTHVRVIVYSNTGLPFRRDPSHRTDGIPDGFAFRTSGQTVIVQSNEDLVIYGISGYDFDPESRFAQSAPWRQVKRLLRSVDTRMSDTNIRVKATVQEIFLQGQFEDQTGVLHMDSLALPSLNRSVIQETKMAPSPSVTLRLNLDPASEPPGWKHIEDAWKARLIKEWEAVTYGE